MYNLRIDQHSTPITEYLFTVMPHVWLYATEVFKPIFPCTFVIRTNKMHTFYINLLTPNDPYSGRTAPPTSKRCVLYIYSTNIGTEHFKHGIYSPFLSLQNTVCFIILTYLVRVLFTLYIQNVLKCKKIIPVPKG